jgi:hypothetical protein
MSDLHPTHSTHPTAGADHLRHEDRSRSQTPPLGGADHSYEFEPDHPVLVSIRWKDAESQGGPTWEDTDEMLEFARRPLTLVLTVGVLLHMDAEQVAVTDTVASDQMGGVTKIPRGWIERIDVLGPATPNGIMGDTSEIPESRDEQEERATRRVG